MKLKKMKKGFTIVELVIVIAVIGVLTAILVPTFINLTAKANQASDDSLVQNLNTSLKMEEAEQGKKNPTMHDAVLDLENEGYKLSQLVTKAKKALLWNMETNQFELEESQSGANYWKIYQSSSAIAAETKGFSAYVGHLWNEESDKVVAVHSGFDAGYLTSLTSVSYTRESADAAQDVVIRTNSAASNLTIVAEKDTVHHHGSVGKVDVQKIDLNHCYNEFGSAAYVKVTEGKVVAKAGGSIAVVFAANDDPEAVAVIKESEGTIETGLTVIQPVSDTNVARVNGIALEYSVDGETASQPGFNYEEAAEAREVVVNEMADAAVETAITEDIIDQGEAEQKIYVARIGTTPFERLNDAVNAAKPGEKITLIADVELSENIGNDGSNNPDVYPYDWTNLGNVKGGLKNELVLSKDIKITFVGGAKIFLAPNGSINLNGFTLTLSVDGDSTDLGAGIERHQPLNNSDFEIRSNDVIIKTNLEYDHETYRFICFVESDSSFEWAASGHIVVGAYRMDIGISPSERPIYISSHDLPRYNQSVKYCRNLYPNPYGYRELRGPTWLAAADDMSFWFDEEDSAEYTYEWSYTVVSGDLSVEVVATDALEDYVNADNGFKQLFDISNQYGSSDYAKIGNIIFSWDTPVTDGQAIVDVLSGRGEILVKATGHAEGEEDVVKTWTIVVY